jgi:hypothetical protein
MKLERFLQDRKPQIIKKWCDLIIGSYPVDTQRFLCKEKNRFANPVGRTVMEETEALVDALIQGDDAARIDSSLENIIKIRAVQDFKPSEAVAFVLQLKKILRELTPVQNGENDLPLMFRELEEKIDQMALTAFDIYSRCKQKLFEIRVNEQSRQFERLLARAKLIVEGPDKAANLGNVDQGPGSTK